MAELLTLSNVTCCGNVIAVGVDVLFVSALLKKHKNSHIAALYHPYMDSRVKVAVPVNSSSRLAFGSYPCLVVDEVEELITDELHLDIRLLLGSLGKDRLYLVDGAVFNVLVGNIQLI